MGKREKFIRYGCSDVAAEKLALLGVGRAERGGVGTQKPLLKGAQLDERRFGWRCHSQNKEWVGVHIGRGDCLCKGKRSEREQQVKGSPGISVQPYHEGAGKRDWGWTWEAGGGLFWEKKDIACLTKEFDPTLPTQLYFLSFCRVNQLCSVTLISPSLRVYSYLSLFRTAMRCLTLLSAWVLALLLINSVTLSKPLTSESLSFPNSKMEVILVPALLGCGNIGGNVCHNHSVHIYYNSTSVHAYNSDFFPFSSLPMIHMQLLVEILLPRIHGPHWFLSFLHSDSF